MSVETKLAQRLIENPKDGSLLLFVPGGKFLAGGSGFNEGGEKFEVVLPPYYLGITAVGMQCHTIGLGRSAGRSTERGRFAETATGSFW